MSGMTSKYVSDHKKAIAAAVDVAVRGNAPATESTTSLDVDSRIFALGWRELKEHPGHWVHPHKPELMVTLGNKAYMVTKKRVSELE